MKPVIQRKHAIDGEEGDCLMASVASILECDLDELPPLLRQYDDHWLAIVGDAVMRRGFRLILCGNEPPVDPPGYAIGLGESPRASNGYTERHAVVALDGHVVHDPDPSRGGLEKIEYWLLFVPRSRGRQRTAPEQLEAVI